MMQPKQQKVWKIEHQLNTVNKESLKIGLKIYKGKKSDKYWLSNLQIDETEIEKMTTINIWNKQ